MLRVFGHHISARAVSYAALELLVFVVAYNISLSFAMGGLPVSPLESQAQGYLLFLCSLTVIGAAAACGLYNKSMCVQPHRVVSRLLIVSVIIYALMAIIIATSTAVNADFIDARTYYVVTLSSVLCYFMAALLIRHKSFELKARNALMERRVLVLGVDECAAKIEYMNGASISHYTTVGFVPVGGEQRSKRLINAKVFSIPDLSKSDALLRQARLLHVDEIVVASRERRGLPTEALIECKLAGIAITEFANFWERQTGQVDLDELTPSWIIFSDGFQPSRVRAFVKRALDIALALIVLVVTLPITIIAAIAIRIDGPGPLFYGQERVGLNGATFTIFKFRSMRIDAEKDGIARWALVNDHRITRIGRFLRRARIDEIPQALNVLLGQMSFVGPRPERPVFVESLARKIPLYEVRHRIKPGITGWAQINYPYGASDEDAKGKLAFDLYYAKNWGLFLDIVILAQTARVVLWPEGVR